VTGLAASHSGSALGNSERLDAEDGLAHLRERFLLPSDTVYLDGNSLGALPRAVPAAVDELIRRQWGEDLIASWNLHDWIRLPQQVGEAIAPLIGAAPGQVLCVDTISVNVFKLLAAALELRPGRPVILLAEGDFPTDGYVASGLARLLGEERCRLRRVPTERLADALDGDVAALLLTEVNYRSGERFDMRRLTAAAHEAGALAVWDLAHSAGAMPVSLDASGADMAVGCGYKFFNGGPGAPGFVYLAGRHQEAAQSPLAGWLGHRQPFAFEPEYASAPGVARFQAGTPPVLGMVALRAALEVFEDVSVADLRRKSLALTDHFLACLEHEALLPDVFELATPRSRERRGSQVSLRHPEAWGISQALIERRVIVDFRAPDIVRFGFAPLYNRFADARRTAVELADILRDKAHRDPRFADKPTVT
jgi:kynureninase